MPRPKKKPDYNPHQIMQAFMDAIADAFGSYDDRDDDTAPGLNAVAAEFGITALKARMNILVQEYRCSGGTDTANPAAGNRCSGTGILHLLNCLLPASLLA